MSNREFDWTMILPEEERRKVLADRQTFFDKFPTKSEIEQAGREGREAFAKACAQVDRNRINDLVTELRKLQDIIDSQADRILDLEAAVAMTNGQCGEGK
jgi:hypothetical protein